MSEAIVAIATPLLGTISHIIRCSGKDCFKILEQTFNISLSNKKNKMLFLDKTTYIYFFYEPASYTGEDMFEIHLWGNHILADQILQKLIQNGARLAKAGEFTQLALLNGKKNFLEVEQLSQIYNSFSNTIVSLNNTILESKKIENTFNEIYDTLLNCISDLEATWDFVEHDIPNIDTKEIFNTLANIYNQISAFLKEATALDSNFTSPKIAIWGLSNVGKSSIFKCLTGYNSIITPIKGTTRDVISATKTFLGKTFTFLDLPGYDIVFKSEIEKYSVEVAKEIIPKTDGILFVVDLANEEVELEYNCFKKVEEKVIAIVGNKIDIAHPKKIKQTFEKYKNNPKLFVSALQNRGFGKLLSFLSKKFTSNYSPPYWYILPLRQYNILQQIKESLQHAIADYKRGITIDIIVDELKDCITNLEILSGKKLSEEILSSIMSKFCIGK
jgi:tRNA modification GTPase